MWQDDDWFDNGAAYWEDDWFFDTDADVYDDGSYFVETYDDEAYDDGVYYDAYDYYGGFAYVGFAIDVTFIDAGPAFGWPRGEVQIGGFTSDILIGGRGPDSLYGGGGHDILDGGAGHDLISGDAGNDFINGGTGDDDLFGGSGADVFYVDANGGEDAIFDFRAGEGDVIAVEAAAGQRTIVYSDGSSFLYLGQPGVTDDIVIVVGATLRHSDIVVLV
jgi:Ca2+-binding RTX toxin-like protein